MSTAARMGLKGGGLTIGTQIAKAALQVLATALLARLLVPADFGLIAMAAVVVAMGDLLRDFGMSAAALRVRELDDQRASNLFWINSGLGALAASLVLVSTPLLAGVYDEPRLNDIVPVMCLAILINGIQAQVQVQLARTYRYVALGVTDLVSQLVGLIAALGTALLGWGYWSLVMQVLCVAVVLLALRSLVLGWIPRAPRRGHGTREVARHGADLGAAQILTFASSNADTVAIGVMQSAADVGIYERAFKVLAAPVQILLGPLTQVVLPVLNRALDEGKSPYGLLVRMQFFVAAPVIAAFSVSAAIAPDFIAVLLGPGWDASAQVFALLALGGSFGGLSFISYWAFIVGGAGGSLLRYNLVVKPAMVAAIAFAAYHGIHAVALAYSISLGLSWPVSVWWLRRSLGNGARELLRSGATLLAIGLLSFVGARAAWMWSRELVEGPWWTMVFGILVGVLCYLGPVLTVRRFRSELRWLSRLVAGGGMAPAESSRR